MIGLCRKKTQVLDIVANATIAVTEELLGIAMIFAPQNPVFFQCLGSSHCNHGCQTSVLDGVNSPGYWTRKSSSPCDRVLPQRFFYYCRWGVCWSIHWCEIHTTTLETADPCAIWVAPNTPHVWADRFLIECFERNNLGDQKTGCFGTLQGKR